MNRNLIYVVLGVLLFAATVAYFLTRSSGPATGTQAGSNFGVGPSRSITVTPTNNSATNEPVNGQPVSAATTKVFKINNGPVAAATLLLMGRPTTTMARFVMADSGHVFDLPLDSPGALARAVSNTTIPGVATVAFSDNGSGVVLQYLDKNTTKTLHLAFPPATTTLGVQGPVTIKFFPDGIDDIAVSPDGSQVAYLVATAAGSDTYTAKSDGTSGKRLFSLPLAQVEISWPAVGTIMAQTMPAAGVAGAVFSVDVKSGSVSPLIYAQGLTAIADAGFKTVIYQSDTATSRKSYARNVTTGNSLPLPFDPYPEQCVWSATATSTLYCASPLAYVSPNYLDLWHAGVASAADSIFAYDLSRGRSTIVTSPGGKDGGEQSDIASVSVSPDDHYLLFIRKGDRSLWGVRLTQ